MIISQKFVLIYGTIITILNFDWDYQYREPRVNGDGSRFMLFSSRGFRILNDNGAIISYRYIQNNQRVNDQQYVKTSGNLVVMYKDALSIYRGRDGEVIFNEKDLRSLFYAPYGVSILDKNGRLRLIDLNSGDEVISVDADPETTFAAYCGMTVDSAFLAGRKLIGAAKTEKGYLFAVSDGSKCIVYNDNGNKLLEASLDGDAKVFFTDTAVILSPIYGLPVCYSLKNGVKIADLERDAYLIDVMQLGEYIVCKYRSTDGEQYGILLDKQFRTIAKLPQFCDTWGDKLLFAYRSGVLRQSRVYTLDELISLARAFLSVKQ